MIENRFRTGPGRSKPLDQLVELLGIKNLNFSGQLLDTLGIDMGIQQLADFLLVAGREKREWLASAHAARACRRRPA